MLKSTKFKYCPQCAGATLEIYLVHGMKCASCGFIYFHSAAAAVAVIIEVEDKIVLLRRAHDPRKGFFDLPGGFVEYRESLDQAAVREVKEELNIAITDIRYFGSYPNEYLFKNVTYFTSDAFFLCRPVDLDSLVLSEENTGFVVISPDEIDDSTIAFPNMVAMLSRYRTARKTM